jgi:high-affinity Fe2+/Pb2+ permease
MKTAHGTTVMWKTSIILVIALGFMLYGIFSFAGANDKYWESVGPRWDRMLNPCKYEICD